MALYSNITDVRAEAGLTGNTNIADSIVTTYLNAAESEINGKIAKRYTLPLDEIPSDLANVATQLAAGLLLLKEYGPESEGTNKDGQAKIKYARDWLNGIADGSIVLIGTSSAELATSAAIKADGLPIDEDDDPPKFTVDEEF